MCPSCPSLYYGLLSRINKTVHTMKYHSALAYHCFAGEILIPLLAKSLDRRKIGTSSNLKSSPQGDRTIISARCLN